MQFFKKIVKNEQGQSIVEFAIVVPILLLVVAGIFNIGLILYSKTLLISAVSRATEHGSYIAKDDLTEEEKILKTEETFYYVTNRGFSNGEVEVEVKYEDNFLYVDGTYKYEITIPLIRLFFDEGVVELTEGFREYIP